MAHTSHVCPYPLLCDIPAASSRLSCADRPVARLLQDQHVEGKTRGKQGVCERKGILRTKACPGPHWWSCQHRPHARDRCFSALVGACVKAGPSRAPDRARLGPSALGLAAPVPQKTAGSHRVSNTLWTWKGGRAVGASAAQCPSPDTGGSIAGPRLPLQRLNPVCPSV